MMKKRAYRISTMLLAIVFMFSLMVIPAYAATIEKIDNTYATIYTKNSSKEYYVWVEVDNNSAYHHTDIRMLDENGQVVWEEYGAVDYSSARKFVCGSNVKEIHARVGAKNILGFGRPLVAFCTVWE